MSSYFHTLTLVTPEFDVLTYPAHQADAIIDEIAEHRGNYASVTMRPSYDAYNQWAEEESARRGMSAPQPLDGPSDKAGARKSLGEDAEEAEERAQDARAKRPRVRGVRPQQVEINDKARGQHRHRAVERGQWQENAGMPFAFTFSCTLEQAHAAIAAKQARPRPGVEAEDIDVDYYDVDQEGAEEEAATSDMDVDEAWEEEEGSIDSVDSLLGCWDEEMEWVEERPKSYDHDDTNEHVDYDMLDDNDDDDDMYEYPHPHPQSPPQSPPHDQDDHLLYSGEMEVDDDDDNDEHPYPHLHSPAALDYQPIYPIFNPDIWRQVEADAEATTASATTVVDPVIDPLPELIPQPVIEPVFEVEEAPPVISVIDQDLRRRWEEAEARKEEDDIAGLLEDEDEDEEGARGGPTNGGRPDLVVPQRRRVGAGKRTRRR